MEPQLQQQEQASSTRRQLDFAEPRRGVFDFVSQVWMQPGDSILHMDLVFDSEPQGPS